MHLLCNGDIIISDLGEERSTMKGFMVLAEIVFGFLLFLRILFGQATGGEYIMFACDIISLIIHWKTEK